MVPRPVAELLRHDPRDLPAVRHHLPVGEGVGPQPTPQPCEPLLHALEPGRMFGGIEETLVVRQLLVREPLDELEDKALAQHTHHLGSVLEHRRHVLGHGNVDVQLELFQHLSLQLRSQRTDRREQLADLGDVLEGVEVGCKLRHGLQQVRRFLVRPRARHLRQLLDRVLQHVEPAQGDDGRRQVLLGKVQRLGCSQLQELRAIG
eukprot:761665-Hanusia_phi.AAC.6